MTLVVHRDEEHRASHHRKLGQDGDAAADAALVELSVEPSAARFQPDQSRAEQGSRGENAPAMQAVLVRLPGMPRALARIALAQLHELDAEDVASVDGPGEIPKRMAVPGARHAEIDLGQQQRIRPEAADEPCRRPSIFEPLGVPEGDARRPRQRLRRSRC